MSSRGARTRGMDTQPTALIVIDPPPEDEPEEGRLYCGLRAELPAWANEANAAFLAQHWTPQSP